MWQKMIEIDLKKIEQNYREMCQYSQNFKPVKLFGRNGFQKTLQ